MTPTEANGYPTRDTWLIASHLGTSKYGYLMQVSLQAWQRFKGKPGASLRARTEMAAKLERDVRANADKLQLAEPVDLDKVHWPAIADASLKRFERYEALG